MPPDDKGNKGDGQSLDGLTKAFGDMTKAFNALPAQMAKAVETGIGNVVARQQAQAAQNPAAQKPVKKDPPGDIEKLSRSEFASHIMDMFTEKFEEKMKPFQDSVAALSETMHRGTVSASLDSAKGKYKDFDQWKDEMGAIVEKHGYLEPEDLYILARSKNPDKAKQIDEAAAAAAKEAEKASKGVDTKGAHKPAFLGLMPTNKAPGSEEGEDAPKFKTTRDAAAAAFDEIMADLPLDHLGEPSHV